MKQKIESFSKGIFEYELPFVSLSVEELNITAEAGNSFKGSFIVSNSVGRSMRGVLYSSHRLLTFENIYFNGEQNEVTYYFNAANFSAGEEIHGEISIISDCGEAVLPFIIQIETPYIMTSLGKIKDLFQFANLARMDWTEAKKVFRSEDFERVFLSNEDKYQLCYRNLRKSISVSQALEEFLIVIHKKQGIHLNIDKEKVEYQITSQESFMDKLTLTKDHWGYAEIRVNVDASFIQLEQKFVWADRFIGNTHQISYLIDPKKLRKGKNFGRIWIKTVHQTIAIDVLCNYHSENSEKQENNEKHVNIEVANSKNWQKLNYNLTKNYLNFRLNIISQEQYQTDTQELLKEMSLTGESKLRELIGIHTAIISGKNVIVKELLDDFTQDELVLRRKSVVEYCLYLYLKALYYKEETTTKYAADTIRNIYETGHHDWKILWFLLYVDNRYEKNLNKKLFDIKEQYLQGCHSPILYYEALCVFNEEPVLLRELTDFEMQVLNFGIKNRSLAKEVVQQYTYLANKKKRYHPVIFQGLLKLYEEYKSIELLTVICCTLIKGLKKSTKYFEWYRLGVEAQLRITELYEYYMYSVDESRTEPLSQPVLLYFIYNSNLNDRKKAFLYANIVRNKEKNETIYRTYEKRIEVFTMKQLEAHHINKDLAILYEDCIDNRIMKAEIALHLPYVMYQHEIACMNPNIAGITVIHKELGIEENQQLVDGKAQVDIYTNNAEIFFIDVNGNRYTVSIDYEKYPLMQYERYEEFCIEYSNHPMLLLHLYDRYNNYRILNDKSINLRKMILDIENISDYIFYDCLTTLVDYYYDNYDEELLEHYLNQVNLHKLRPAERNKYLEYMVIRSLNEEVLEALEAFGFEGITINRLVKLCSGNMMNNITEEKQAFLLALSYYVFSRGKYDETMLRFLVQYYYGPTREMFQLWQAARGFELETNVLEERLLTQMLFAESYVQDSFQVFHEYYKSKTNHVLVKAFLNFYAYRYIVHDRVINSEFFQMMRRELNYEDNDIWLIAWLKFQSFNLDFTDNECDFVDYSLNRLQQKGIILPFYQSFQTKINLSDKLINKYYVEYKTNPNKKVYIHYRILKPNGEEEFITELMPNVFMGIYVRGFVLFYHEILQYYITEEYEEEVSITESFHVHYDKEPSEIEESKYNQINLMLMAKELHDDKTLLNMMEHFVMTEYKIERCFEPIV